MGFKKGGSKLKECSIFPQVFLSIIQSKNIQSIFISGKLFRLQYSEETVGFYKVKILLSNFRLHAGVSSAAPMHRDIVQFFANLNIPIYELFGQSECSGPVTTNNHTGWKVRANIMNR